MEWVETTAKTLDEAREMALDRLGVGADEAEFDVLEEPRPGLFGRLRGEARLRARVKPAQVRPKQERRRRSKSKGSDKPATADGAVEASPATTSDDNGVAGDDAVDTAASVADRPTRTRSRSNTKKRAAPATPSNKQQQEHTMTDDRPPSDVSPQEVGVAAVAFMDGLTAAFGLEGSSALDVDGLELEVSVQGSELGLLVGPGGRTLNAVQDLARVSAQRRLGDHDTRLRIDVAGYRERREAALAKFARDVADQVRSSGDPRSLEPMTSADRKVIHDVLNDEDGVQSRSEGDDPNRRIVVEPAD